MHIAHALHVCRVVDVGNWNAHFAQHLAAAGGKRVFEGLTGVDARAVVLEERVRRFEAALKRELCQRHGDLRVRMPPARDVRVFRNDARRRRAENEERFLRLRRYVADGNRVGRHGRTGEDVDPVLHDQLLRLPLRHVGRDAGVVAANDHDLPPGDRVAVCFLKRRDHGVERTAAPRRCAVARIREDDADLNRSLVGQKARRRRRRRHDKRGDKCKARAPARVHVRWGL